MAIPVVDVAQMREWEKATWATGQTEKAVIELVGARIAERILQLTTSGDSILVVAGKGHNGDDAKAAVTHLSNREVTVVNVVTPEPAADKLETLFKQKFSILIDGLFGIGLNRPLNTEWQHLLAVINQSRIPILSVDVPSGLNAETGKPEGAALRATTTLTVGAPKRGMLFSDAVQYVGRLEVLHAVGLIPPFHQTNINWVSNNDFLRFPGTRDVNAHKGTYGHVAIIAGSLGYHGAAVLAARGASRAQPGLVSVYTQADTYHPVASHLQSTMVHPYTATTALPHNATALLMGPGLAAITPSSEIRSQVVKHWMESPLPVVVDASALDWLPAGNIQSPALRIMTPHPGEAARMLQSTTAKIQSDRFASLKTLSEKFGGCWVVLKGHQTLVGRAGGEVLVNSSGNPYLAQGGSGDLLSGLLAGLIAQPALQTNPAKTISYAVWRHGAAADRLTSTRKHWTIEDLAAEL